MGIPAADALTPSTFHDEPPSLHEKFMQYDRTYRWLINFTTLLVGSLYVGLVGAVYVMTAGPLTILSAALVSLSSQAPLMHHRYDPMLEIWGDHMVNVLEEPAVLVSPRLNDLFGQFDKQILVQLQLRWFKQEMARFSAYLAALDSDDGAVMALTEEHHRAMITLCDFLKTVPHHVELIPEAMQRIQEWIDIHAESVQTK